MKLYDFSWIVFGGWIISLWLFRNSLNGCRVWICVSKALGSQFIFGNSMSVHCGAGSCDRVCPYISGDGCRVIIRAYNSWGGVCCSCIVRIDVSVDEIMCVEDVRDV